MCSFLQYHIIFTHNSTSTDQHQHCSQTQSTVYPQCHRPIIIPTSIKTLQKQTQVYISIVRNQDGEQNIMKLQSALLQINFLPITQFCKYLFLNATAKQFMFPSLPKFQAIHQLCHDILRCDNPVVPQQYTVRAETYPIYAQLHCSYYKWQLRVSATQQPSSGCLCEKCNRKCYIAAYLRLKQIGRRSYLSLT